MRHIVSLSGGKDSSALAIYLNDRAKWRKHLGRKSETREGYKPYSLPEIPSESINYEYVFCDTDKELPETYAFLDKLETVLNQKIIRLNDGKGFDYYLDKYKGFLPSPRARWCTTDLKIKPFERFIGDDQAFSYIGIRADENREGYIVTSKKNITPIYPFKEDGIVYDDVLKILNDSGVGYPEYYKWRTRSGCYFCFFQRRLEWVGLLENHPHLFEKAKAYEKEADQTGEGHRGYTWASTESLAKLEAPERIYQIKTRAKKLAERARLKNAQRSLFELLPEDFDTLTDDKHDEMESACLICE